MENLDQIVAKVRKVLALAERAGTEHEAAAAAARAGELLAKYNLSMSDIAQAQETIEDRRERHSFGVTKTREGWKGIVLFGVAKMNFCTSFRTSLSRGQVEYNVVGRAHNVLITRHMTEYLIAEIDRLADEAGGKLARQRLFGDTDVSDTQRAYKTGFREGAAAVVQERLLQAVKERTEGETTMSDGSKLPALVGLYKRESRENYDFLAREGITLGRSSSSTRIASGAGYRAGQQAGQGIGLNSQVAHSAGPRRLGRG